MPKTSERKMKAKTLAVLAGAVFAGILISGSRSQAAEIPPERLVRLAELEIDPAQLAAYRAALREEIETSVRVEPGVLALYAVTVKDHPNQIRLFEMYASPAAYQAHLQSAHFKKYKSATAEMVKSLRLIETEPLLLESK
ncbi:putative quinol monooxygenase, partial [Terriglobus sp. YAF25]|uniref:putative quinol monooxygenase n=2 Tax=unclassified Terriglobus TaxID=2628988 RepID=UPI003F9D513D